MTVIYPEKSLWILLGLMGIDPDIYIPVESSLFTAEGLKVWAVSVKHADDISCFGYIIEFAGEKIYYSGDSYEIPKDVLDGFYKGKYQRSIRIQQNLHRITGHIAH